MVLKTTRDIGKKVRNFLHFASNAKIEYIFAKISALGAYFCYERSVLQSVAVRQSTGNNVSGHYFCHYFHFSSFFFFLRYELFS